MIIQRFKGLQSRKARLLGLHTSAILTASEVYGVYTGKQLRLDSRVRIAVSLKRYGKKVWATGTEIKEADGRTVDIITYFERDPTSASWKLSGEGRVFDISKTGMKEHFLTCHNGGLYSILTGFKEGPCLYFVGSNDRDRSRVQSIESYPPALPTSMAA